MTANPPTNAPFDPGLTQRWLKLVATDPEVHVRGHLCNLDLQLHCSDFPAGEEGQIEASLFLSLRAGRPVERPRTPAAPIEMEASTLTWDRALAASPPPGHIDVAGLDRSVSDFAIVRGRDDALRHLAVLNRILELGRLARVRGGELEKTAPTHPRQVWVEGTVGRYVHLSVLGRDQRIFFEEAGDGPPIVCLHTAGADSRQWRHLLNDPEIAGRYHVVAFDFPWHGRSMPPDGWWKEEFLLTADLYCAVIEAVCDALRLERPVLMGCSMGGSAVLEMTRRRPDRFAGGIAISAAAKLAGRFNDLSVRPDLNAHVVVPSWVWGLMSPDAPQPSRRDVWWIYSQAGPGIYRAGTYFYSEELDLRRQANDFDTTACPLVLLTGSYDYACTPADSALTAAAIPGAQFIEMPELGHFAPTENYPVFRGYLDRALNHINVAIPPMHDPEGGRDDHT